MTEANGEHIANQEKVRFVWIDQDLCTGDGLCEQIAPDVFTLLDDGLAYVKNPNGKVQSDPARAEGIAPVSEDQLELTLEAMEECPGECIFGLDGDKADITRDHHMF
jgi:ferredoxin